MAVVGGGAGGMFASVLLARAGHEVTVVKQDRSEVAPDVEAAAETAYRSSAPQIVQPHIVMARCRNLLRYLLPDVYDQVIAAGASDVPLALHMPPTLADREARDGDELLSTLATRRSTLDWVLRRAVLAEPRVTVLAPVRAVGLLSRAGDPPHVIGVRTEGGEIRADLVVDAAGRRSAVDDWLSAIGARPPATWSAECGVAYFTRHYRVRPGAALPGPPTSRLVVGLDEFTAGIWGADNAVMQVAVAPLATDRRFRTLRNPDVHAAVVRTVAPLAPWLDALEPITAVFQMAGLHNTLRRLVVDGEPVVTGLSAVGDSVCTTNPTLGRGLALALWGASDLVATLDEHGDSCVDQALALDACVGEHVAPFYEDQARIDEARLAMLRHAILGEPAPPTPPPISDRVTYSQLRTAALYDPTAFRGLWNVQGMIRKPSEVYSDIDVVAAARETLAGVAAQPVPQPTRTQLLDALEA